MGTLIQTLVKLQFWRDEKGQDFVEYALLAGFVASAVGSLMPYYIVPHLSGIFSKVTSALAPWAN